MWSDRRRLVARAALGVVVGTAWSIAPTASGGVHTPGSASIEFVTANWQQAAGSWSDPTSWDIGSVPNNRETTQYHVFVDPLDLTGLALLDIDVEVKSLWIGSDDAIEILNGGSLSILAGDSDGSLINTGLITLSPGPQETTLRLGGSGNAVILGGGMIQLTDQATSVLTGIDPDERIVNVNSHVEGTGRVGDDMVFIRNAGTIEANVQYKTLVVNPNADGMENVGVLRASGAGRMRLLDGVFANAGGLIEALDGSRVDLEDATIVGGVIASSGTGIIRNMDGPATFDGVTLAATHTVGPTSLTLRGQIVNDGAIELVGDLNIAGELNTNLLISPDASGVVSLDGVGRITALGADIDADPGVAGPVLLINEMRHTIEGYGELGNNTMEILNRGTIESTGADLLVVNPAGFDPMVNEGTIRGVNGNGVLLLDGTFTNNGLFEVMPGSRFVLPPGSTLTNLSAATLTGGTYRVIASGLETRLLLNGPGVVTNAADVTLSGEGSFFPRIDGMSINVGSLSIVDGRVFSTFGFLANSGRLAIGVDSAINVDSTLTLQDTSMVSIELPVDDEVSSAGLLTAGGNATLAGMLELLTPDGLPPIGAQFEIISAVSISGTFESVIANAGLEVSYGPGSVIVTVVAGEPCPGDLNGDGTVGAGDTLAILGHWGTCPPFGDCPWDVNGDGVVDNVDLLALIGAWGPCP